MVERFAVLYTAKEASLVKLAHKSLRGQASVGEATDLVQEVALKMFAAAHEGDLTLLDDANKFYAFAARVVQNSVLDWRKASGRQRRDPARERSIDAESAIANLLRTGSTLSPSRASARAECATILRHAMTLLSPDERAIVEARVHDDRSFVELARALGSSPDVLRRLFHGYLATLARGCSVLRADLLPSPRASATSG